MPLAPTVVNAGGSDCASGVGGTVGSAPPAGVDAPNSAGGAGSSVAKILFTFLKPEAIIAAACMNPNIPP